MPGPSSTLSPYSLSPPPSFPHFLYLLIYLNLVCVLFPNILFLALNLSVTFLHLFLPLTPVPGDT